jgi:hypothetical protein
MKNGLTCLIIASSLIVQSQNINTREYSERFSNGTQNAITTIIYTGNIEDVKNDWKKLLKKYKNEKVKVTDNEVFGDNILIKEWGNNTIDVYAKFEVDAKTAASIQMAVAVDLGGAYLSSSGDKTKFRYMEDLVKNFAVAATKKPIQSSLKDGEKLLQKQMEEQKDLERENKNLKESIEENRKKITKTEDKIIEKETALEKKNAEVNIQKKVVESITDLVSDPAKSAKKTYDKLIDQQKSLEKDKKSMKSDIDEYTKKIKTAEENTLKNETNQVIKKAEVEKQKIIVSDLVKRLEGIN